MKIKRYMLSVLIIIVLVGLFTSARQVRADAYSDCIGQALQTHPGNMQVAEDECMAIAATQPSSSSTSSSTSSSGFCNQLGNKPKLQNLLNYVTCIISKSVIPLIFALALVLFIWGVVQYVINSSEEAKKEKGKQFMIWGIIALTVMVSVWGLVRVLGNTFGIDNAIPQVSPTKPLAP